MPKRPIPQLEGLTEDSQRLAEALSTEEPDLSVVLIGSSYLDACLGALLKQFLRDGSITEKLLDSRSGALGSFTARSDLCYCLKLISKEIYQDLITIAEIRNELAHNYLSLSFSTDSVSDRCARLKYFSSLRVVQPLRDGVDQFLKVSRTRFVLSVIFLSQDILNKGRSTQRVS